MATTLYSLSDKKFDTWIKNVACLYIIEPYDDKEWCFMRAFFNALKLRDIEEVIVEPLKNTNQDLFMRFAPLLREAFPKWKTTEFFFADSVMLGNYHTKTLFEGSENVILNLHNIGHFNRIEENLILIRQYMKSVKFLKISIDPVDDEEFRENLGIQISIFIRFCPNLKELQMKLKGTKSSWISVIDRIMQYYRSFKISFEIRDPNFI